MTMAAPTPWRDVNETTSAGPTRDCPVCGRVFRPVRRQAYCTPACRQRAWRRRHQPDPSPAAVPAPRQPRRPVTVYACPQCETRYLGEQRCPDCNTWCARVGVGGLCPHCDDPVALPDLLPASTAAEADR